MDRHQLLEQTTAAAERATQETRRRARHLSALLLQSAFALEHSAKLADDHARRRERSGSLRDAADERETAARARAAARRARAQAQTWRDFADQ